MTVRQQRWSVEVEPMLELYDKVHKHTAANLFASTHKYKWWCPCHLGIDWGSCISVFARCVARWLCSSRLETSFTFTIGQVVQASIDAWASSQKLVCWDEGVYPETFIVESFTEVPMHEGLVVVLFPKFMITIVLRFWSQCVFVIFPLFQVIWRPPLTATVRD